MRLGKYTLRKIKHRGDEVLLIYSKENPYTIKIDINGDLLINTFLMGKKIIVDSETYYGSPIIVKQG